MVRPYSRSQRGERCRISAPHGYYKTTTVTAASRTSGLVATTLFDGATNGELFLSYLTNILAPVLKRGHTVILDDLDVNKAASVRTAIAAAGACVLYLPAYRPDFNPIEQAFAKLKTLLRTAAARTVPNLWVAIRNAVAAFKPSECRNYVAAAKNDTFNST